MRKRKAAEERPWGTYEVLQDRKLYKLKEIVVNPGERLSYQSHHQRTEVWTIVSGEGIVTLEGQVDWQFQKEAALRTVRYVAGVKDVVDRIGVKSAQRGVPARQPNMDLPSNKKRFANS